MCRTAGEFGRLTAPFDHLLAPTGGTAASSLRLWTGKAIQYSNQGAKVFGIEKTGGEGGILSPPLPASADESYTSVIIPCVLGSYKRIRSSATVSIVSLIRCNSRENGIRGISGLNSGNDRHEEIRTP